MSAPRPAVSVIVPFHGSVEDARMLLGSLRTLATGPGDEVVVVDNTGAGAVRQPHEGVRVLEASEEQSAYYARNRGAESAMNDWLLFMDSDCRARTDVIDRYFDPAVQDDVGALVGEVVADARQGALVARYARQRGHLTQRPHWEHPFRPWGITANLLVRRRAWADVGGFHEGIRSAGDTEFSWRLQDAGWQLGYRPDAVVAHRHRETVRRLVRQAARYAAGRAWVMRRYPGSFARPTLVRRLARCGAGIVVWTATGQFERARYKALDAVFIASEWAAFGLSNTPPGRRPPPQAARVGAIAGTFPAADRPSVVDRVSAMPSVVIEAAARPVRVERSAARALPISWAEDDGAFRRAAAGCWLVLTRPRRVAGYVVRARADGGPALLQVAAPARRLAAAGVSELRAVEDAARRDAAAIGRLLGLTVR